MDICVFGAGSLGSLVGGILAREHAVTLVGRDPHIGAIRANGLTLTGEIESVVTPTARTTPPGDADLAVVTVKSFDTATAASQLTTCSSGVALSVQNGMGNEELLADALDCPVLAGTCTYGARLVDPGTVECTGVGDIALGPPDGGRSAVATRVGRAFSKAGLATTVAADMPKRRWEKLAINAGINATTALARVQNGALVDGPAGQTARTAARETARVARSAGVDITGDGVADATMAVASTTADNTSSMLQDVQREKRTEVDAINGYVVDHAREPVPVNETLAALLRAWERERGLRPAE